MRFIAFCLGFAMIPALAVFGAAAVVDVPDSIQCHEIAAWSPDAAKALAIVYGKDTRLVEISVDSMAVKTIAAVYAVLPPPGIPKAFKAQIGRLLAAGYRSGRILLAPHVWADDTLPSATQPLPFAADQYISIQSPAKGRYILALQEALPGIEPAEAQLADLTPWINGCFADASSRDKMGREIRLCAPRLYVSPSRRWAIAAVCFDAAQDGASLGVIGGENLYSFQAARQSCVLYNTCGGSLYEMHDYLRAEEQFHLAVQADPSFGLPFYNLARLYADTDKHWAVVDYLKMAITLDPQCKAMALKDKAFVPFYDDPEFEKVIAGDQDN